MRARRKLTALFLLPLLAPLASCSTQDAALNGCTTNDPVSVAPANVKVTSIKDLDAEQLKDVKIIIGVAKSRGLTRADAILGVQVAYQESRWRNLHYGTYTSVGIFQQQTSWGTVQQRQDPVYASNKFFAALERVKNRASMSPLEVAYAVQNPSRAAYSAPGNSFNSWRSLAESVVGTFATIGPSDTTSQAVYADTACPLGGDTNVVAGQAETFVKYAITQVGKPYVFGAESPGVGFDCSGLTQWAAKKVGFDLPRVAHLQYRYGTAVDREHLQRGDPVFWAKDTSNPDTIYHVGIYLGNNQLLSAPHPGADVRVSPMYYSQGFIGGRRLFTATAAVPAASQGWQLPLPQGSYNLSSPYGLRFHPVLHVLKLHDGQDMGAPQNTPIYAVSNGVVEKASMVYGYGNFVVIKHAGNVKTGYGHMIRFESGIAPGVTVTKGQIIGYVGQTGLATGNHLHFMTWENGHTVNPAGSSGFMARHGVSL